MADTEQQAENMAEEVAAVTEVVENLTVQEVTAEVDTSDTAEGGTSSEDTEATPEAVEESTESEATKEEEAVASEVVEDTPAE